MRGRTSDKRQGLQDGTQAWVEHDLECGAKLIRTNDRLTQERTCDDSGKVSRKNSGVDFQSKVLSAQSDVLGTPAQGRKSVEQSGARKFSPNSSANERVLHR